MSHAVFVPSGDIPRFTHLDFFLDARKDNEMNLLTFILGRDQKKVGHSYQLHTRN